MVRSPLPPAAGTPVELARPISAGEAERRVFVRSLKWKSALVPSPGPMYQPQDGAVKSGSMSEVPARLKRSDLKRTDMRLAAAEPEDAWLTGTTRSLMRRVSGLNVSPSVLERRASQPAARASKRAAA